MNTQSKKIESEIPGLRDFMAVSALSILSVPTVVYNEPDEWIARKCYAIADAMLKVRDENSKS